MKKSKFKIKSKYKFKKEKVQYVEKKPFLADKEIIFRSGGRAKVFNISHNLQIIMLSIIIGIFAWSGYNSYFYHISENIINHKDKELDKTRDAYIDLMSDLSTLQSNISTVVSSLDEADNGLDEIKNYKEQALVVKDKIQQLTASEMWINQEKIEEKVTKKEALLQKEMVQNENNMLRQKIESLDNKINELQATVKGLESAEITILDKISELSGREIEEIKISLAKINKTLKNKKRYFNPLANIKTGEGGAYIPEKGVKIENKELLDKMSSTFNKIQILDNYKSAMQTIPLGKPLYRFHVTSPFGTRNDPFKTKLSTHKGIDLGANKGSRISAMAGGKVITATYQHNGYGNLVVIDHGNGFTTKYAHMNKIYVKKGDRIEYNQAVGEVGRTGRATGNHLHYEVIYRGVHLDPQIFMNMKSMN